MYPVCIVTCADRLEQGAKLANRLGASLVCDWDMQGAIAGHVRALEWAERRGERVIIMEDDAIPVDGFAELAADVLGRWHDDLVSLYLGTGYPEAYQPHIEAEVTSGADVVKLQNLIHGVCYSVPNGMERAVIDAMDMEKPADYAIGRAWWKITGREVIYPLPSLGDHADGPRVEQTGARHHPRRAWRLHQ